MDKIVKKNFKYLKGSIEIPPDKSLSHRAIIFASLAKGKSVIKNFSSGKDPHSSLAVCKALGTEIIKEGNTIHINSEGKLSKPSEELFCGNSGTTMRLFAGVLASEPFESILTGDLSLSSRPMKRIITPLNLMGADIQSENNHAPLKIKGGNLHGINYTSEVASAQVKSCILLAGLKAEGETIYTEPYLSRNHTEIMLKNMGADIITDKNTVKIKKSALSPIEIEICGDISSAAYFITAGLIVPNSEIILKNVNLNPTRTGIIEVIKNMGGQIEILNQREICSEISADIRIKYSENLKSCTISSSIIPKLIDEIPIIALLATQCEGKTIISDAQDLRNKESDRIKTTVTELNKLGANIEETPDGMIIYGKTSLKGGQTVNSYKDHRLAMTLYIAGLICENEVLINNFEWVNISFPEFESLIEALKK
jgi:3-phosphoshikimate 1-carboxyvinyltransferase